MKICAKHQWFPSAIWLDLTKEQETHASAEVSANPKYLKENEETRCGGWECPRCFNKDGETTLPMVGKFPPLRNFPTVGKVMRLGKSGERHAPYEECEGTRSVKKDEETTLRAKRPLLVTCRLRFVPSTFRMQRNGLQFTSSSIYSSILRTSK